MLYTTLFLCCILTILLIRTKIKLASAIKLGQSWQDAYSGLWELYKQLEKDKV